LLLHADFVFAARDTTLSTPFRKVGIPPEFASSFLFPQRLGHKLAARMLLKSETVSADTWLSTGALTSVADKAGAAPVLELALAHAREISAGASEDEWSAVLAAKDMLRAATRAAVDDAIQREFDAIDKAFGEGTPQRLIPARLARLGRGKL
jgi:enoyl-CoA hydratase/carnithine racemase